MPANKEPKKTTAPKKTATAKRAPAKNNPVAIPFAVPVPNAGPGTEGKYSLGLTNKKFEIDLPSGAKCLAIRPGPGGLISAGLLDSMDQLTAFVQMEHIDGNDPRKQAAKAKTAANTAEEIKEGLALVDKAICYIVQSPRVYPDVPLLDDDGEPVMRFEIVNGKKVSIPVYEKRDPEKLYPDDVDMMDKMFIFNWAMGGTAELASFRAQHAELMGSFSAE